MGIAPPPDNLVRIRINGNNNIAFREEESRYIMSGFFWIIGHPINADGAAGFESFADELIRFHFILP
jgi:hypothetical protein